MLLFESNMSTSTLVHARITAMNRIESPEISRHKATTCIEWSRPSWCPYFYRGFQLPRIFGNHGFLSVALPTRCLQLAGRSSGRSRLKESTSCCTWQPSGSWFVNASWGEFSWRVLVADFFPHRKHQPQVTKIIAYHPCMVYSPTFA